MELTDYHAKYIAYQLTRRCPPDSVEKLAAALVDAQVDLNPHQIDAALFAFRSPLSKGALLADEVGLGKTIEAGLVLSQKWAERKRRVLVIVPSNLRTQWYQELTEKFFLPCRILEFKSYNAAIKQGQFRPFEAAEIVICSYQFAKSKAGDVHAMPWDLVVIDEAHRLRNVYKPQNVIANTLKLALAGRDKLLLTATPLQNSLLELFGLVSFIDEHAFGDLKSFREQFANLNQDQVFQTLKARLKPVCHRTLRRQVLPYIKYTRRWPLVQDFKPEESEDRLYHLVSDYLQRDNLQALPASQRSLMTLVLRKLLASSTFAIAGALTTISARLKAKLRQQEPAESLEEELDQDYETLDETADEWSDDEPAAPLSDSDRVALEQEIADLDEFARLATSIEHNAKGKALLKALDVAFAKAAELGGVQKAIIFTESRRTQNYLLRVLGDSPFAEGIVLFNGSNTDERSKQIYTAWVQRHQGTDRLTGSRTADMRAALVDYFRDEGRIMIATEAGAEGIESTSDTHIIPRLKKVVDGEDPGGITKSVDWKGGGGFRYYRIAPSLLEKDKWGNWVIHRDYNAAMLAEALCKLEGFSYAPSNAVYWQQGHSTERDFIYVTTATLNHERLQQLCDEVGPERSLLVLCPAFRGKAEYPNLTVKKIPKQVLSRCEWGHDDYSLRVENLPQKPPEPGQQSLDMD